MSEPAVRVEGLAVAYGGACAVDSVGFAVGSGEQVTLLGPSGCGKTTTLRAIAGLERPVAGRIEIGGATVFDAASRRDLPPERRGVSMVFQSYAIWPHMSVFENVAYGLRARRAPRVSIAPSVHHALDLVALAAVADRSATRLSGGQQQRVALARAIACDARVILLDEPLSNLDAELRIAMRAELAALRRRLGFTAIYVTHDQEEAFALSDRIIVMQGGQIEQDGAPEALHATPRTRFVARFLGMRNILEGAASSPGSSGHAELRMEDGTVLRGRSPWACDGAKRAAICFRPLDVVLSPGEGAGQGGTGVVAQRLFLGDMMQIVLRCRGYEIVTCNRPRDDLPEGAMAHWRVPPERCVVVWR